MSVLAHHVAPHHVAILVSLFAVGIWFGWQVAGTLPLNGD